MERRHFFKRTSQDKPTSSCSTQMDPCPTQLTSRGCVPSGPTGTEQDTQHPPDNLGSPVHAHTMQPKSRKTHSSEPLGPQTFLKPPATQKSPAIPKQLRNPSLETLHPPKVPKIGDLNPPHPLSPGCLGMGHLRVFFALFWHFLHIRGPASSGAARDPSGSEACKVRCSWEVWVWGGPISGCGMV